MSSAPLMPKATAVWLVENTALSFDQVADFCKLHPLEIKAIADGDAAQGIKGADPVLTGQLSREEIDKAVADPTTSSSCLNPKSACPRPSASRARATRRCRAARTARTPSCGWCATSRAQGQSDHAARRHHQVDHRGDPRAHPLERAEPPAHGPGDARAVLADRSRPRSAPRRQGEASDADTHGATLLPASETTIRPREPEPKKSRARSSVSKACSPSSRRSAARASRYAHFHPPLHHGVHVRLRRAMGG